MTTPMSPRGATLSTRNRRWKLCSWIISSVNISTSIKGTTASTEACDFALSSAVPPTAERRSRSGRLAPSSDHFRSKALHERTPEGAGATSACTVRLGTPIPPPDQRELLPVDRRGELRQRHVRPFGKGSWSVRRAERDVRWSSRRVRRRR